MGNRELMPMEKKMAGKGGSWRPASWFAVCCSIFISLAAFTSMAAALAKEEFKWALELFPESVSQESFDFYRMTLPQEVYHGVSSRNFNDIRIYDAGGRMIQHSLETPSSVENRRSENIPIYPIFSLNENVSQNIKMQLRTRNGGTIVSVDHGGVSGGVSKTMESYILDISHVSGEITSLSLDWTNSGSQPIIYKFRLETSDDLNNWRSHGGEFNIYRLNHGGNAIQNSKMDIVVANTKYARIVPLSKKDFAGFKLHSLKATTRSVSAAGSMEWTKGVFENGQGNSFSLKGEMPIEKIRILDLPPNVGYGVTIQGRDNLDEKWHTVSKEFLYHLKVGENRVLANEASFLPTQYKYWRIVAANSNEPYEVEFGWRPHVITFAASPERQNKYFLAFGREEIEPPSQDLIRLISQAGGANFNIEFGGLTVGEIHNYGGEKLEQGGPGKLIYALWSAMGFAIFILMFVAKSIYRQMNAN